MCERYPLPDLPVGSHLVEWGCTVANSFLSLSRPLDPCARRSVSVPPGYPTPDNKTPDFNTSRHFDDRDDDSCSDHSYVTADGFEDSRTTTPSVNATTRSLVVEAAGPAAPTPVVTVLVQNLPIRTTPLQLFGHFDDMGFQGQYDFVQFPMDVRRGLHKGFAFVNFLDGETAARFIRVLNGTQLAGKESPKKLTITPADRQGREALLAVHESNSRGTRCGSPVVWERGLSGGMEAIYP